MLGQEKGQQQETTVPPPSSNPNPSPPILKPAKILEAIRFDLRMVQNYVDRPVHDMMDLTDFSCSLNAQIKELSESLETAKSLIKTRLIQDNKTISEGHHYLAVLSNIEVNRLDTDRVKQFLGKRLADYLNTSNEMRLSFKPK